MQKRILVKNTFAAKSKENLKKAVTEKIGKIVNKRARKAG